MKKSLLFKSLLGIVAVLFFACGDPEKESAKEEYNEFKAWWNDKTDSLDVETKEEWQEFKTEFNERTAKIDAKLEKLGDEDRKEYEATKSEYSEMEASNEEKWANVNREGDTAVTLDESTVKQWEVKLMGKDMGDWSSVTAANVKQAYIDFMENVRAQNGTWTDADWDYVDVVFDRLDARKDQVDDNLDVTDEAKIKALQMEYRTLETAAEAKTAVD